MKFVLFVKITHYFPLKNYNNYQITVQGFLLNWFDDDWHHHKYLMRPFPP